MIHRLLLFICLFVALPGVKAQEEYSHLAEYGATVGLGHYFGDLNMTSSIDHPKLTMGIFYQKQFTNYTAVRVAAHYAELGYSDRYSSNEYQKRRNLSFNTDIFELTIQGEFNFFKFNPYDEFHNFTPYITLGAGVFTYDPYTFYRGEKVYLRPLHTEGEGFYQRRKQYGSTAFCFPLGFGFKYALSPRLNILFEVTHRFTTTDYLDDVSTTYIGANNFPTDASGKTSLAALLQDRSYETGTPIGVEKRQRGWSKQKDQYIFAEIGISFNITSYLCPTSSD